MKLIQQYFIESAKKYPDKIAVNFRDQNITFQELEETSNRLANALRAKGAKRGDRVCFCLRKSIRSIQIILAILKADAIYVPLNAQAPAARLRQMINDATPKIVICDEQTDDLVRGFPAVFNLDRDSDFIESMPASEITSKNSSDDLAYILYTSGSTGVPKGVMITHGNIINATDWAVDEFQITEQDRISQHPPLHFDLSTFDLYCAFKAGATLLLVPEELSLFPGPLMRFIEDNQLTIWNSVPSVMVYLSIAGLVKPDRISTVRKIFFNGEGFPPKFLAEWMKDYPNKEFINMYGPTETTVQCTFYRVLSPPTDFSKLVPIGKATGGMEIFAVKDDGSVVGPSEEGELYVGGLGVGNGYWNNPEKTAEVFIEWPTKGRVYRTGDLIRLREDGNYEFIGRKDNQVKVMGNRIELGDVDSAMMSLPYIKEAAALAVSDLSTGGNRLIVIVSLQDKKRPEEIKKDLEKLLPYYMIPQEIKIRDALPRTSTGKVDRVKLKNEL